MAIQKMALVHLAGPLQSLDKALAQCLESGIFQPESALHSADNAKNYTLLSEVNPYAKLDTAIQNLAYAFDIRLHAVECASEGESAEDLQAFVEENQQKAEAYNRECERLKGEIHDYERSFDEVSHLVGMELSFEEIFAREYVKYRFGKLPCDSVEKLKYYGDKTFFFFPERTEGERMWGAYFAPKTLIGEIDDIFASLYFERVRIPSFVRGKPSEAIGQIEKELNEKRAQYEDILRQKQEFAAAIEERLCRAFTSVRYRNTLAGMRSKVAVQKEQGSFSAIGFIPKEEARDFAHRFDRMEDISCVVKPQDADPSLSVPVKLKNNWFTRPFETFVNMYSLPSHADIDPTSFVAITYTLLFGIMFGDLGQGLLIALIGLVMSKWKKMEFGKILTRIGLSSAWLRRAVRFGFRL